MLKLSVFCSLSSDSLPVEELVTTPTLTSLKYDINTRYLIAICRLCQQAVPLSHIHSHSKAEDSGYLIQTDTLQPLQGKTLRHKVTHLMKMPMGKEKLIKQICSEVSERFGPGTSLRDIESNTTEAKREWYDGAIPFVGQVGPIAGIRVVEIGAICSLCPDLHTARGAISTESMRQHRMAAHPKAKTAGELYVEGPMQTMATSGGIMRYFPVLGGPVVKRADVALDSSDASDSNSDEDDIAVIVQREKEALLQLSTEAAPNVIDVKSLVPFYRDHGIHEFLSQYSSKDLFALFRIPPRRSKETPVPLRRLYTIANETFLEDCEMAVRMNPAIRRLIIQSDPYVVMGIVLRSLN